MAELTLSPETAKINAGQDQAFTAAGGTGPYLFTVVAGEPGEDVGSVEDDGTYTAPPHSGVFTVTVTDSADPPDSVSSKVTVMTPLTWLCDILQTELGLENGQVYLWNQKINVPNDHRLYLAVGVVDVKVFGNRSVYTDADTGLNEDQRVNCRATVSIDVMSRGPDARDRKEEVVLALRSTYAKQVQEANGFYLAGLPTGFVNLSQLDGAAIPYRFNLSVALQYQVSKSKAVDYYDDFTLDDVVIDPAPPDYSEEDDG